MTMYRILYKETARRALKKIPKKWQARLVKAIDGLKHEPFQGKKLQGELHGLYSLRVWPYRIIYQVKVHEVTIFILTIGHRQGIYK